MMKVMKKLYREWLRRAAIFSGLLVLVGLMVDFNARLVRLTHLRAQYAIEEQRLEEVAIKKAALVRDITYANSDTALEDWAREEGRLVKPGDIAVIPLPLDAPASAPEIVEPTFIEPENNWGAWIEWLFFGRD